MAWTLPLPHTPLPFFIPCLSFLVDGRMDGVEHSSGGGGKTLKWNNIQASVPVKKAKNDRKTVLDDVSGVALPGEVLAIMGGSGAGKTTLMNILAKLDSSNVTSTGVVEVNGRTVSRREMQMMSAYVQQVDVFCGSVTVEEQLVFSARLRLPRRTSKQDIEKRVDDVIRQMNLSGCQHTLIGIPGRKKGISIGEKKRLAFASEILTDPPILFCDEPTSGLDSYMAAQVVTALEGIAKKGKTVITVIHQPSTQVFNMLDKVCFMSCGKTAYHGPVNKIIPFFDGLVPLGGFDFKVPESFNPADHAIRMLSVEQETKDADAARVKLIREAYENSDIGREMSRHSKEQSAPPDSVEPEGKIARYPASCLTQIIVLTRRAFLTTLRDPILVRVRFIQIICTGLVVGGVAWQIQVKASSVASLEGVLFNAVRDMNFLFVFPSINFVTAELPLFFRENKARIYSVEQTKAYYLSKSMAELPQYTVLALIYSTFIYWMTGLYADAGCFVVFCALSVLQTWVATSVGYAGACIFGEEGIAVTFMPLYILPMLVFGGFYINQQNIPIYYRWMSYISWFRYEFTTLEINQWKMIDDIPGCEIVNGSMPIECPGSNGIELLAKRGIKGENMMRDTSILVFFFLIYRFIGFIALFARAKLQKSA